KGRLPVGRSTYQTRYTFIGNGDIKIKSSLSKKGDATASIPRVGMQLAIPESYNTMNWYGRGPQENYIDRNEGAAIGRYSGTVEELVSPYVRPQENANRTGVRWFSLTNDRGEGLMFIGEQPLSVSAWPYSQQDLAQAEHTNDLPERDYVTGNVDLKQMGLGGNDSWSAKARPLKNYRLTENEHSYRFIYLPVSQNDKDLDDLSRQP